MRRFSAPPFVLGACVAACGLEVVGGVGDDDPPSVAPDSEAPSTAVDGSGDERDVIAAEGGAPGIDGAVADVSELDVEAGAPGPGTALRFSNNSYVQIGALAIPTSFTVEAWVRPSAFGNERHIVAKDRNDESKSQFRIGHDSSGRVFFMMSDDDGEDRGLYSDDDGYALRSPASLPLDVWSHVAVTKSGAQFVLYVDGIAVQTVNASASFSHGNVALAFRIGARIAANGTGAQGGFVGDIDEVRLWDVGRTAAQIAAGRMAPLEPNAPGYANLVAYYRFDEGAGTTAAATAGTFSGTLMGTPTWVPATWP